MSQTFPTLLCLLVLLEPPSRVSLQPNGLVGQLQVSWKPEAPKYFEDNLMFKIRYASKGLVKMAKVVHYPNSSRKTSANI